MYLYLLELHAETRRNRNEILLSEFYVPIVLIQCHHPNWLWVSLLNIATY